MPDNAGDVRTTIADQDHEEGHHQALDHGGERLLYVLQLGLTPYDQVWAMQREAARLRIEGTLAHDLLILCEHPPVVTLGRASKAHHLLATPEYLQAQGIELRTVERGGDVTVHEPGQLVGYPIVDLKLHRQDLHWYLRQLEEVLIRAVAMVGIAAQRRPGLTGVWVDDRKLASIGVHARDWVTWHGFAINVSNTLATFDHVVPCGIDGVSMTSVARESARAGVAATLPVHFQDFIAGEFGSLFELDVVPCPAAVQDALHAESAAQPA